MTYFDNYFGEANSQNSYYDNVYTDVQPFSYAEEINANGISYDYYAPYEPEYVPQSFQVAEPIVFSSPSYYIEVPQVFATEIGGTTYYQYSSLYYPVYSTPVYAEGSYDDIATTTSSSISTVTYSESISSSMASTNSLNNTTEVNYANIQVSNIVFENSFSHDWHNNSQINTETYATDYSNRNVGMSGDFEGENSTTFYNRSGFSQVNSSIEASSIQFEGDSKAHVKFLKDRLYIFALSGKLYLKDSVPAVDILPMIEEESNLIEDDNNLRRPGEEPEIVEIKSLTVEKDKELGLTYKKSASNETREINCIATKAKFKNVDSESKIQGWEFEIEGGNQTYCKESFSYDSRNRVQDWTVDEEYEDSINTNDKCDFLENVNSDSQTNVPDWTVEVDDGVAEEEYDVNEHLNNDSENTSLDWTTEVEEENDSEQKYEDYFYKIDVNSSPSNIDEYESKQVTEYRKEQLYISALSGYMSLKEYVPVVDIIPVIEEESSSVDDDYESDLKEDLEKEKSLDKEEIYKEIDHTEGESKVNESTKYLSVKIDTEVKTAERESPTEEYNSVHSPKEIEKNEETLIESSKSSVQTHQSGMQSISNNEIKAIEIKEKNASEVKKKRFENIRKWFRSLCCCMKNEPN